jgi:hypothetical protein
MELVTRAMRRTLPTLAVSLAAIGVLGGCHRHTRDDEDQSWEPVEMLALPEPGPVRVDMLFVIDNSNSMREEQTVLSEQMHLMVQDLIAPSDPSIPEVTDLHVGVVTTDLGSAGFRMQSCDGDGPGDDGVLQNAGLLDGCQPTYSASDCDRDECPWLDHSLDHPDDGSDPSNPPIWDDFACIASLGVTGCGMEQQLEASLVALTTQTEPGQPNEGFLRDDSALVVIYVTDEDDCSSGRPEMFDPQRTDLGHVNIRCAINPDELYPISRYHDAFAALRGGNAIRVAVAAIAGVPIDGTWDPGDPIEELRELQQIADFPENVLVPSCESDMGEAYPPVRIAELVYSFGRNGVLQSICQTDWGSALRVITQAIQDILPSSCVDRDTPLDPERCRVVSVLGSGAACPDPADSEGPRRATGSQVDLGLDDSGRRRCEVLPADYDRDGCPDGATCPASDFPDGLQGWFFTDDTDDCPLGEIRLTGAQVTEGAIELRLECLASE